MSRLCDRVTRRASPGLDTDLSGLGLDFSYPGNVRRRELFPSHAFNRSLHRYDDGKHFLVVLCCRQTAKKTIQEMQTHGIQKQHNPGKKGP